ncbi:MAG: isoprenylcysteine carboxylmethyltransferase family protein [Candidatus Bathyarchaeota archaeon]|nr:MAG: isoprenylcysteine carboxylmethyltransferase family protein [Candidatus Bathyarchaeota archaeon]
MQKNNKQLRIAGIKQLLVTSILLSVQMALFFLSAGHVTATLAWLFFLASFLHNAASTAVQYKFNAELLVQRLKLKRKGSKLWDEILMRVTNLTALVLMPVVAGLDYGRFLRSSLGIHFTVAGLFLFIASSVLINWAMLANPYFEQTVRVQKDRSHRVISGGPYQIVRHPGYLGGILYALSFPLIIGSIYTFIPAGIYVLLMVTRTLLEDRTLQRELCGYKEYAEKVRYRLLPWLW